MTARLTAALLLLTGAPSLAVADGWLGAAAGGGWDSNVNLGVDGTSALPAGYASVRAQAGLASAATREHERSIELAYDGTFFPEYPDLDLHRPSLTVAWAAGDATRLRLAAFAGLRAAADPARSGWDAGATASVRRRLGSIVALRASGGFTRRVADDPALSTATGRGQAGVDVRLGDAVTLWAEYQGEGGTESVTRLPSATDGGSSRRTTDSFGGSMVSSTTTVFTHGPAGGLWVALGKGFSLSASYRQTWLLGDQVEGTRRLAVAELGWVH